MRRKEAIGVMKGVIDEMTTVGGRVKITDSETNAGRTFEAREITAISRATLSMVVDLLENDAVEPGDVNTFDLMMKFFNRSTEYLSHEIAIGGIHVDD